MRRLLFVLLIAQFGAWVPTDRAWAQDTEDRERIGLVLAGGGARGLAHAGVIRALEEFQVPVDAVAGTSMGALIGGLYAVGHDADELQRIIEQMDWRLAFEDTRSRRDMSPRRKADDYDYASHLGLSIEGRQLSVPIGIIQGQQVRMILEQLTQQADGIEDFDDLPIPYRAVATDFATGNAYVFDHGDLVTAMRASMSIPGLLAPVEVDNLLLVDGGIASNVPILAARTMDVDRLIIIDIGLPLMAREEITDFWSVTEQTLNFLTRRNSEVELRSATDRDIVITPALGDYGILDFAAAEAIYRLGYEAGLALRDQLLPLALDDEAWQGYLERRRPPAADHPTIAAIRIDEDSGLSNRLIGSKVHQKAGEPLDRDRLAEDIEQIYALGYWNVVDYRLEEVEGATTLVIHAEARSRGERALKLGIQIASDLDRNSELNLGGSYLLRGVNRRGAELYARAEVGNRVLLRTQFYQPVDHRSRFFLAPWLGYEDYEVYSSGPELDPTLVPVSWRVREFRGELVAGLNLPLRSQLRAGVFHSSGKYLPSAEYAGDLPEDRFDRGGLFASARWDDLDDAMFPRSGTLLFGEVTFDREEFGADLDYERWIALGQTAMSFGRRDRNIVVLSAKVAQTVDAPTSPQDWYRLGGLFNLSGHGQFALGGRQLALAVARYQYRIAGESVLPFGLRAWAGFSVESGQLWREPDDMRLADMLLAGSMFIAVESPIGPIHVAYGYAEDEVDAFYLTLGWPFLTHDVRMER